jgi:hypothetical protein
MGRGPFMCIAAGPASALASLAGGAREHDGRRGHRPGRGLRGADVHAGPDRVRPAGCRLGLGPARPGRGPARRALPAAAELLADAAADLLAFTAFPAETGARPGPTIPGAAEQRARRACLPTGGCSCSRITSGPGSSRFPLWASVTTSQDQHSTIARHARNRLIKLPFGFGICPCHQAGVHYGHRVELSNS